MRSRNLTYFTKVTQVLSKKQTKCLDNFITFFKTANFLVILSKKIKISQKDTNLLKTIKF